MKLRLLAVFAPIVLAMAGISSAATYEVGPGRELSTVGEVPWESLQPGDTVLIHARAEPYQEKFVIGRAGTADAPITVRGVPGPDGDLPVMDGNGATTRSNLSYWGDVRGVIKIGGARNPADTMPKYIVIENLDVRGGRPPFAFTAANGQKLAYHKNAAAVYVEKAEHLTIRGCRLHDCGNGLFVSSNDERASRDILVEGCHIFDNGNLNSGFEHNVYTEAAGMIFQYNHFGPLRANCVGNNIKDRSAGLIIRYNWIEGGNKELDLVEAQDSALVRRDPAYHEAFVHGNVLLKLPRDVHSFLVHYGSDSDSNQPSGSRKGTLHFYQNTIVSYRMGVTPLFRLSTDEEHCDFRNNLVYAVPPKAKIAVLENRGSLDLSHSWFKAGWAKAALPNAQGTVRDDKSSVVGMSPGFVDAAGRDFRLTAGSACRDAGGPLPLSINRQYVKHQSGKTRPDDGRPDIGAFEFGGGGAR
jgi:hypothetical protein